MNIWLKEISMDDGEEYYDLLMQLADSTKVYARPVPETFPYDEFESFKKIRIRMQSKEKIPASVMPTTTYWVMDDEKPIGYATLKHEINPKIPGGHFGLCLLSEYQNRGIGKIVSDLLQNIAYNKFNIEEVVYTSKDENIQSQKNMEKIGGKLTSIHDGYHFYIINLKELFAKKGR